MRLTWKGPHPSPLAGWAYFLAMMSLLLCPMLCAPAGVVCGVLAYRRGDRRDGALSAIASAVLGGLGTALFFCILHYRLRHSVGHQ